MPDQEDLASAYWIVAVFVKEMESPKGDPAHRSTVYCVLRQFSTSTASYRIFLNLPVNNAVTFVSEPFQKLGPVA